MIFLLLIDFAAVRTGSRAFLAMPLWVTASVRENEDFVSGLLSNREWCLLGGSEEEWASSALKFLLNFNCISFFSRCCSIRVPCDGGSSGGEGEGRC